MGAFPRPRCKSLRNSRWCGVVLATSAREARELILHSACGRFDTEHDGAQVHEFSEGKGSYGKVAGLVGVELRT